MRKSILLSIVTTLLIVNNSFTQTYWGNNITTDTTWTVSMSPIILTNGISVLDSATLTIQDSVQVNLVNGSITVNILGGLEANGVTFAYPENQYQIGLNIEGSANLQNCDFTGTGAQLNMSNDSTSKTVNGNNFHNAHISMEGIGGTVSITNNNFTSSLGEYDAFVFYNQLPEPTISGNTFANGAKIQVSTSVVSSNRTLGNYQSLPFYGDSIIVGWNNTASILTISNGVILNNLNISIRSTGGLNANGVTFAYPENQYQIGLNIEGSANLQNCDFTGTGAQLNMSNDSTSKTVNGNNFHNAHISMEGIGGTVSITNNNFTSSLGEYDAFVFYNQLPEPTISGNTFANGAKIQVSTSVVSSNRTLGNYQSLPFYGDSIIVGWNNTASILTISNGVILNNLNISIRSTGGLNANGVTFAYPENQYQIGLNIEGSANLQNCDFTGTGAQLNMSNDSTSKTVNGNNFHNAHISMEGIGGTVSITNNNFTSSLGEYDAFVFYNQLPEPTISGNTFANGAKIQVSTSVVSSNRTLGNYQSLPFYGDSIIVGWNNTASILTISNGVILNNLNISIRSTGGLNANGVTFAYPENQYQIGLNIEGSANLQNCDFTGTGAQLNMSNDSTSKTVNGNNFHNAHISMEGIGGTVSITNNNFTSSLGEYDAFVFYNQLPEPTISGNTFANGAKIQVSTSVVSSNRTLGNYQSLPFYGDSIIVGWNNTASILTISNGVILNNLNISIRSTGGLNANGVTFAYPENQYQIGLNIEGSANLQNCDFTGTGAQLNMSNDSTSKTVNGNNFHNAHISMEGIGGTVSITNNNFTSSLGEYDAFVFYNQLPEPTISNNTFTGSARIGLKTCRMSSNRTLKNYQNLPYDGSAGHIYVGEVNVPATLTIESGVIYYYPHIFLELEAGLIADGVTFTYPENLTMGLEINGTCTITNSVFNQCHVNFGSESNNCSINYSDFMIKNNEVAIINVSANMVNAENNYWNGNLGPYNHYTNPEGNGCSISENVDFMPYSSQAINEPNIMLEIAVLTQGWMPINSANVHIFSRNPSGETELINGITSEYGHYLTFVPYNSDIMIMIDADGFDPLINTYLNLMTTQSYYFNLDDSSNIAAINCPEIIPEILNIGTITNSAVCSIFDNPPPPSSNILDASDFILQTYNLAINNGYSQSYKYYFLSIQSTDLETVPAVLIRPNSKEDIKSAICDLVDLGMQAIASGANLPHFTDLVNPFCAGIGGNSNPLPLAFVLNPLYQQEAMLLGNSQLMAITGVAPATLSALDQLSIDPSNNKTGSYYENGVFVEDKFEIPNSYYSGHLSHPNIMLFDLNINYSDLSHNLIPTGTGDYTFLQRRMTESSIFDNYTNGTVTLSDPIPVTLNFPDSLSTPVNLFTILDDTIEVGQTQYFDASDSYDPNGLNLNYEWFVDNQLVSNTQAFNMNFGQGDHIVTLRVNNILNNTSYSSKYFYIATGTGIGEDNNQIISDYKIEQNYPNPFNPSTTISYSLPTTTMVQLKIFNILGQEIARLVNEEKHSGNYKVEFDASHLSSGIYLYQIKAGDFVQTRKMILLK